MDNKALRWFKAATAAVLLAAFSVGVVGCNTFKGAGKDIESAGKSVQRVAQNASD